MFFYIEQYDSTFGVEIDGDPLVVTRTPIEWQVGMPAEKFVEWLYEKDPDTRVVEIIAR